MTRPITKSRAFTPIAVVAAFVAIVAAAHWLRAPLRLPLPGAGRIGIEQLATGLLLLLASGMAAAFAGYLIVRYETLHARWSIDPVAAAPQKSHATPTPRIGSLCLTAGLLVSEAVLLATGERETRDLLGLLLLAGIPAFLGGIAEDLTKNVRAAVRLLLNMLAAALGAILLGAVIPRLDVPGLDWLLIWSPFAIAFTAFAAGGVANSINIIDGYNGLAGGHAAIADTRRRRRPVPSCALPIRWAPGIWRGLFGAAQRNPWPWVLPAHGALRQASRARSLSRET